VHTMPVPTVAFMQSVLTTTLPAFIRQKASKDDGKPIKLLIIDALGELFHSSAKTTNTSLFQRSKDISSISASLHELASTHKIAVVVLNEVIDRFARVDHSNLDNDKDLLYENQSRWFSTAEFFGENKKEASLGLVWANQVNTRIMLTRTGRRKYFSSQELPKRRRMNSLGGENEERSCSQPAIPTSDEPQATLIRRLTVIFSNVSSPVALDYVVTEKGIIVLPDEIPPHSRDDVSVPVYKALNESDARGEDKLHTAIELSGAPEERDEEEHLWSQADPLSDVDWDAFEEKLSQQLS